jgi:hypothetical protein
LIKLAIELHDLSVRIAVIDKNVVSDDVAARPLDEVVVVAAEEIARALNFRPVLHLESDMMHFLVAAM